MKGEKKGLSFPLNFTVRAGTFLFFLVGGRRKKDSGEGISRKNYTSRKKEGLVVTYIYIGENSTRVFGPRRKEEAKGITQRGKRGMPEREGPYYQSFWEHGLPRPIRKRRKHQKGFIILANGPPGESFLIRYSVNFNDTF